MTVYVDDAFIPYRSMLMCHMIADTEDELHAMAAKIGIQRKWYQAKSSIPHYDISKGKRDLAVGFGAKEVTGQELVKIARGKKEAS